MTGERPPSDVCAYCGLPLETSPKRRGGGGKRGEGDWAATKRDRDEERYCCFGCRFAHAVAAEGGVEGEARWTMTRLGISIFLTMNVMMFTMALWTEDIYEASELATPAAVSLHEVLRYICLILSAPVLLMLGGPLLENALAQARRRQYSTDLLIVLGVLASFLYSVISTVRGQGHVYFEVGCVVLTAVTLGRWMEAMAKIRATRSLKALAKLLPDRVRRLEPNERLFRLIPLEQVQVDDVLRVGPGERIPVDGHIIRGRAAVDQQVVTGESEPVIRDTGTPVYSGSLNLDGDLLIRTTAPVREGTLQRLASAVQEAAESRGEIQKSVDRIARWFVPGTMLFAAVTFLVWGMTRGLEPAILTSLAVVLIACPCAIGIATPLAIWAALGRASAAQVLVRNGDALPELARCGTICFDKTGTLTGNSAEMVELLLADSADPTLVWTYARVAADATRHILADSLRQNSSQRMTFRESTIPVVAARTMPGRGVCAELAGEHPVIRLGSALWMEEQQLALPPELARDLQRHDASGYSQMMVGWDGAVQGVFLFREQLRPGAQRVLRRLAEQGLRVVILTGDKEARARQLGEQLGVEVRSSLLPTEKQHQVRAWQQRGSVVMVGDGFNDAPALAQANVSLAMRCGADLARETADICLLGDNLDRIPWLLGLSKCTSRTIRQNLFWAFAYNVVGVGLAACGLLHPALAAMAMVVSSVKVVTNSLKIGHFEDPDFPAGSVQESQAEVQQPADWDAAALRERSECPPDDLSARVRKEPDAKVVSTC
jgi:heavy metal translocating P-type ATPase